MELIIENSHFIISSILILYRCNAWREKLEMAYHMNDSNLPKREIIFYIIICNKHSTCFAIFIVKIYNIYCSYDNEQPRTSPSDVIPKKIRQLYPLRQNQPVCTNRGAHDQQKRNFARQQPNLHAWTHRPLFDRPKIKVTQPHQHQWERYEDKSGSIEEIESES